MGRRVMRALCALVLILGAAEALAQGQGRVTPLTPAARLLLLAPPPVQPVYCCKVCSKGKACGDSCISRSRSCHVGPGCACDG
ncbi:hypothetical protein BV509_14695 [Rhodovulum sulfidophilum]|uniref:Uncharacterized protein n=1 Tax=Rhodovulum visakhapatnamense TaxID=364297 RepID=A0ABS1RHT6_9RHOB|nr:hypothetical protein [Rhodovulum visakhapatnamense]MBL3568416.1 hypothetical protein [Rhodovulum visakhapatnamense]MBL3579219.1 hypothetical protein [Rhodovulum visakhapatnamense]OLS45459.1 hypothetical protein BV509_14695 [Rhodovulum sulfidophilum]